jgi:uncharacterized protein YbjT (DUF2867 family)
VLTRLALKAVTEKIPTREKMDVTLVTGATGLVGYNIVAALLQRRRQVRALVRSLEKAQQALGWAPTPLRPGLQQTIAYLLQKSA